MRVAVVILNYNGQQHLRRFLPSVLANSNGADIIVADNDYVSMAEKGFFLYP